MSQKKLDSLRLIIQRADEHDSLLGMMSRVAVDTFIQKHSPVKINRNQLVDQITQDIHRQISALIYQQEESLIGQEPRLEQEINFSRNQRRIEQKYLQEKIAPTR